MEIINKSVRDLVPYENIPRNNDEAVEYVAASIREFGFKVPIVIDRDGVIVAGHTRIKAANAEFEKGIHKELPKYAYPLELVTAAAVALYSKYGVEFSVSKAESYRISALDQQKAVGKGIFGAGYLISEREKAEREKAEREKAERWELSDREWEIVRSLGKR